MENGRYEKVETPRSEGECIRRENECLKARNKHLTKKYEKIHVGNLWQREELRRTKILIEEQHNYIVRLDQYANAMEDTLKMMGQYLPKEFKLVNVLLSVKRPDYHKVQCAIKKAAASMPKAPCWPYVHRDLKF